MTTATRDPDTRNCPSLDIAAEVPCVTHDGAHPADVAIRTSCPSCPYVNTGTLCWDAWRTFGSCVAKCRVCGRHGGRDDFARIVQVLR